MIVVVGSLNADLVVRVERFACPGETITGQSVETHAGGKGANQAYGAARLGAEVAMVGCVGDDAHGRFLRQQLADAGVGVDTVQGVDAPTGLAVINVDAAGQNHIVVIPGANACLTPDRLDRKLIESADVVMLQLEVPLETVLAAVEMARGIVILDPAPARPLPPVRGWLTPNESELLTLLGEPAGRRVSPFEASALARRVQASHVVVKLGDAGAVLVPGLHAPVASDSHVSAGLGPDLHVPAVPVEAVDTTAAGDAFNAAFAVALLEGRSPADAARFAVSAAAVSVTRPGAQSSMPTRADVALASTFPSPPPVLPPR